MVGFSFPVAISCRHRRKGGAQALPATCCSCAAWVSALPILKAGSGQRFHVTDNTQTVTSYCSFHLRGKWRRRQLQREGHHSTKGLERTEGTFRDSGKSISPGQAQHLQWISVGPGHFCSTQTH